MALIQPQEAESIILEKMKFIENEYSFSFSGKESSPVGVSLFYKKNKVGVEAIWDVRDQLFEIKISLLDEKVNFPKTYALNSEGKVVRGYITAFLGEDNRDFGGRAEKSEDIFDNEINRFLFLAKTYKPEILEQGII